jgi:hypothetical protein
MELYQQRHFTTRLVVRGYAGSREAWAAPGQVVMRILARSG